MLLLKMLHLENLSIHLESRDPNAVPRQGPTQMSGENNVLETYRGMYHLVILPRATVFFVEPSGGK